MKGITQCKVKIPVEPYYRVRGFFSHLSRVSSPTILPVLLCYLYFTRLLNCSDDFPRNLFLKKLIITALFSLQLVLKAVGTSWRKKCANISSELEDKKCSQRVFNTFYSESPPRVLLCSLFFKVFCCFSTIKSL